MPSKMQNGSTTSSLVIAALVGSVVGFILATAVWQREQHPTLEQYQLAVDKSQQLEAKYSKLEASYTELETQSSLDKEQYTTELEAANVQLELQKKDFDAQLASLKKQQKKMTVTQKKLDTKVVALKTTAEKQKVVLDNSKELYQQQLKLQKQVDNAAVDVKKAQAVAIESKKACDEFKSGTSWDWVSEADCTKYEAKLDIVQGEQAKLSALEAELEALNRKIEISLPK
ncbi:chromosome segregation ATPase [Photobacterium swingsii]|uniref:chromosome segregation ATPase n=1 Tax=Photobacterium swingsii TaxID=680026 RepID=UPI00354CA590